MKDNIEKNSTKAEAELDHRCLLSAFKSFWHTYPSAFTGTLNTYELCWVGRIANSDHDPLFPEVIERLVGRQREDGGIGPTSPHPFCDFIIAVMFANTLLKWPTFQERYSQTIQKAVDYAVAKRKELKKYDKTPNPYGKWFKIWEVFSRSILMQSEIVLLLEQGRSYLSIDTATLLSESTKGLGLHFPYAQDNSDNLENAGRHPLLTVYGEHFFYDADTCEQKMRLMKNSYATQGVSAYTGFLSHYYIMTRDESALFIIRSRLEKMDYGLRPAGRLQEIHFVLYYLLEAKIDVHEEFAQEVVEFSKSLGKTGVGVEEGRMADCDATAMGCAIAHKLGVDNPMPTHQLEMFWETKSKTYKDPLGSSRFTIFSLSPLLHVLDAYLQATDVSFAQKRTIWQRAIQSLATRPWVEAYHISPFYVWEKIISVIGSHAHLFPDDPTDAHQQALAMILQQQDSNGGFKSHWLANAAEEETAFALLALKIAFVSPAFQEQRQKIERAARQAQQFLLHKISSNPMNSMDYPELWTLKLLTTPINIVKATIVAALYLPFDS